MDEPFAVLARHPATRTTICLVSSLNESRESRSRRPCRPRSTSRLELKIHGWISTRPLVCLLKRQATWGPDTGLEGCRAS